MTTPTAHRAPSGALARSPAPDASPSRAAPSRALTIPEACQRLGIGRSKLYDELARGHLAARKAGNRTLILEGEVERYLADLPAARFTAPPDAASAASRAPRTRA